MQLSTTKTSLTRSMAVRRCVLSNPNVCTNLILRAAAGTLVCATLAGQVPDPAVRGTLRTSDSKEPIPQAQVGLVGGALGTESDSSGVYVIHVPPGRQQLRFARLGFATLTVDVFVVAAGDVRLDVELEATPLVLTDVQVRGNLPAGRDPGGRLWGDSAVIGASELRGTELRADRFTGEADVLRGLAFVPGIEMREEAPTALHVRGGSADQNLILLDGVPIYSPYHAGGFSSALNPDVVARLEVHTAVPPASYGGRLSDVIAVRTIRGNPQAIETRGAAGLTAVREAMHGPLPFHAGQFVLSARRSYRDLLNGGDGAGIPRFSDAFGDISLDFPRDTLELVAFRNDNALGFGALVDTLNLAGAGTADGSAPDTPGNRFTWASGTQAVIWRHQSSQTMRWETRAWRAGLNADVAWVRDGVGTRLRSSLDHLGLASAVSWPVASSWASAGFSLERFQTRYDFRSATDSGALAPLQLASAPTLLGAFVEDRWRMGSRLAFTAGVRGNAVTGGGLDLEPRLSLRFAAGRGISASVGVARLHQYVQSLRNEESMLDAVFSADLPVAVGVPGLPVARADQVAATIETHLGPRTSLSIDGYLRWLNGLALIAPATTQPFATSAIQAGSGQARGLDLALQYRGDRFDAQVGYALGFVTRRNGAAVYHPAFERKHAVRLALAYRPAAGTTVEASVWAATGRPTTLVADGFDWQPYNPLSGSGEIAGSPQRLAGPLNQDRLPPYARVDLGVQRQWHAAWLGRTAVLTTFATVNNLFDRRNVFAYVAAPDARRRIGMLPLTLSFGIEWRY